MTVSASRRRRNRSVTRFLNRVVAIATVKLKLTRVQLVAERDWLFWFVSNIDYRRMNPGKQTGCQITGNTCPAENQQDREFVDPCWKMKLLHNVHPFAVRDSRASGCLLVKSLIIVLVVFCDRHVVQFEPPAHTSDQRCTRIPLLSARIDLIKSRT